MGAHVDTVGQKCHGTADKAGNDFYDHGDQGDNNDNQSNGFIFSGIRDQFAGAAVMRSHG